MMECKRQSKCIWTGPVFSREDEAMTERVCATGLRRYRSRSEAEQLVRDFESSGLTRQQFCARNQVATNTFNRYMQRYGGRSHKADGLQQLVPVEIVESVVGRVEVVVVLARGRRVEVGRGFDANTLQQVVAALEAY
jgi:hypothetical protein